MREAQIEIPAVDGTADGRLLQPETAAPGVIFLPDIGGIRPAYLDRARRLAERGFAVLVPNPFYRTSRSPVFDFQPNFREERTQQRFRELAAPLTPEAVERDAGSYVDFLAAQPGIAPGPVGVVGHCFTGAVALRIAAARPDAVAAAASFHGGGLYTAAPTSPHLVLPRVRARLYFAHADQDRSMPADAITALEAALAAWGGDYRSETYAGAAHGWTASDTAAYDPQHAERAFEAMVSLFDAALRG